MGLRSLFRKLLFPIIAVLAAFVVGGLFVLSIGGSPIETYRLLIGSALWWPDGIGYTLFLATPLIFTGLAVAVAFRAGLLNIGAEGQLYVAAFATAWVGIVFGTLPGAVLIPMCVVGAIAAGAIWGAIPGVLKARFGSHEVINTIMLNFIAVALASYFTQYHYKTAGDPIMETAPIGANAHIARLAVRSGLPERVPLSVSFLLALLCCVLVYLFLWRQVGLRIRHGAARPPECGASHPQADRHRHGDFGRPRRHGRHQQCSAMIPLLRRVLRQLRLHWYRRRAARSESVARRPYRTVVRR